MSDSEWAEAMAAAHDRVGLEMPDYGNPKEKTSD